MPPIFLVTSKSFVDDIANAAQDAKAFATLKEFDCARVAETEIDIVLAFPSERLPAFDDALLNNCAVNRDKQPTTIIETRLNLNAISGSGISTCDGFNGFFWRRGLSLLHRRRFDFGNFAVDHAPPANAAIKITAAIISTPDFELLFSFSIE